MGYVANELEMVHRLPNDLVNHHVHRRAVAGFPSHQFVQLTIGRRDPHHAIVLDFYGIPAAHAEELQGHAANFVGPLDLLYRAFIIRVHPNE